jgi:hypothetical protein
MIGAFILLLELAISKHYFAEINIFITFCLLFQFLQRINHIIVHDCFIIQVRYNSQLSRS